MALWWKGLAVVYMNIYENAIKDKINRIAGFEIFFKPEEIICLPEALSDQIVCYLLSCACCGQNELPINISRKCLCDFPKDWICNKIQKLLFKSINIYDYWDYRRLLELSNMISDELLEWAISISNHSIDVDIIEAADDFKKQAY